MSKYHNPELKVTVEADNREEALKAMQPKPTPAPTLAKEVKEVKEVKENKENKEVKENKEGK